MKLVDIDGNEISGIKNKKARLLEEQLNKKVEKLLEPLMNKLNLSGRQIPQQQLMQITSVAHQMLFNRMIFNMLIHNGIDDMDELIGDDDIEELQTTLSNQIRFVDSMDNKGGKPTPEA